MRARGLFFVVVIYGTGDALYAADERKPAVGVSARIDDLVLPGSELEAIPQTDRQAPIVLRIVNVYPHGTAFRYDLEYQGLAPGSFDLKDYLRHKDSTATGDIPSIPVEIASVLPAGQILPNELEATASPRLGGYRTALIAAGILWGIGLLAIVFLGRRRKADHLAGGPKPATLADHLRPLVEGAVAGRLSTTQLADLERTLIVYWGKRLKLADRRPVESLDALRRHPDAGPLLNQLEAWLHRPVPAESVDVAALLEPYRNIPADAVEVGAPAR